MHALLLFGLMLQDPTPATAPEILVTAAAREQDPLEAPYSTESLGSLWLETRGRTLTDSMQGLPSVMVQKTSQGQASPYLRGFTGFRTMMLVDGIRLNHAAMREGPNQYWSTVDRYTVERLELVRGPGSVLYGSDAIGGTVNAVTRRADFGPAGGGVEVGGRLATRMASAENSTTTRAEMQAHGGDRWGFLGGMTIGDFGDLEAGSGTLPNTGYDERDADARMDFNLGNNLWWTLAAQTVRQIDVPRTHTTVFSVPFAGTTAGTELQRDLDQTRDLLYSRWNWTRGGGWMDQGEVTLSYQRHEESQDRLRLSSGDLKRDRQGFDLQDLGLLARFTSEDTGFGRLSWGAEGHMQSADSYRDNFVNGAYDGSAAQGPIGDDSTYTDFALYAQDEIDFDSMTLIPGLRLSWFQLDSNSVANPDSSGPPVIGVEDDWFAATGSLRGVWPVAETAAVFAGLSQGFRAPNLSDLTSLDSTSVVETPSPGLEPEHFLQAEVGTKGGGGAWAWQVSAYQTMIDDMIVRSPTGVLISGVPEVQKSNVGDGWLHGIEVSTAYAITDQWQAFINGTWMDGEVDDVILPGGEVVTAPSSRMMPLQAYGGLRWQQSGELKWVEAWFWAVDNQDQLSLKDETDTERIPPGGTPGYTIFGLTAGMELQKNVTLSASLENIGDVDYRVHGSGVNAPGRNFVLTVDVLF
jgi:hemoglobin/transferrin/lactoferrin receptor protein